MKKRFPLLALFGCLALTGCVSLDEEKNKPDTPVQLFSPAQQLKGAKPLNLYVDSPQTVADIPLRSRTIQHVAAVADPAVVSIYVRTATPVKVRLIPIKFSFTGIRASLPGIGLGSGFFIHPSGYVLSNEHVIRNATDIRIMTYNGTDYIARLVASDPVYDLALLKIESPNQIPFAFIPIGDSNAIRGGDHVIAVGNPLGFGHTVTAGIISHTGRSLFEEKDPAGRYVRYLQTDTAINPGSSGGPLITLTGACVGVNTAQIADSQGIGFTVPSSQVKEFLSNVLEGKGKTVE
ncbi:Periplasmic serine endoprotease DegP [Pontiella desulfatans]|uniref:Periplasmic serine endoprotease DegP n=1 Tax=Pontiella desulfatans TaxID=2750659 RepID=A0A6C2UE17_PONDE|nr:trypsin-like peptidase domain-containing protein [Pontiella desulfatans]VGO17614.1 Periplasmic serine endoprotease DegP [Pontiella desulfatans]